MSFDVADQIADFGADLLGPAAEGSGGHRAKTAQGQGPRLYIPFAVELSFLS